METQVFDKVHAQRLTQLADHLENAESLGVGEFSFQFFYSREPCGTVGCALGECAFLWPDHWRIGSLDMPITGGASTVRSAMDFFGITRNEAHHLFYPNQQDPTYYGGSSLGSGATRKQVASNIREFLKIKGAQL